MKAVMSPEGHIYQTLRERVSTHHFYFPKPWKVDAILNSILQMRKLNCHGLAVRCTALGPASLGLNRPVGNRDAALKSDNSEWTGQEQGR